MSKLFVVGTPIGNLSDITLRTLEVLKAVDVIACEDTRVTSRLLARHNIKKELISYHQHSDNFKVEKLISLLSSDKDIALVTDAGTPGVSDPGNQLIEAVVKEGFEVVPIPGASALAAALSVCHFGAQEFVYYGFLPQKKGRQTKLRELSLEQKTIVLYESVYRIKKLLNELLENIGDREVCVCRELTKVFETIYRGKISEVLPEIVEKGEFVVIIKGEHGKK